MKNRPSAGKKQVRRHIPSAETIAGNKGRGKSSASYEDVMFRTLADSLLDVIMVFDRNMRHLYVNPYVEKQTGIPHQQFIGKTHQELGFPVAMTKVWEEAIRKVFDTGQVQRIEFQLPNQTWIDWLLMPEKDKQGAVQHVITVAREITERKRLEEDLEQRVAERTMELLQSEKEYRDLFHESQDMIYISSPEGRYIDINPAGISLLGFSSREEALRVNVQDCYGNRQDRKKFQTLIGQQGYVKDYEVTLKRRDNVPIQVLITANVVKDKDGRCIAYRGIIRDITERRKLEQQLFHAQKMESIGTMAGGIAHDFNNILGGIMGFASLMKTKMSLDHPFYNYVDIIERGTQRAAELTSQLLTLAMGGTYNIIPVNLNDIILDTINMLSRLFDRSLRVETNLDEKLPTVEADFVLMQQVLMNLLMNASDALPQGGLITIETQVEAINHDIPSKPGDIPYGRYVVVSVSDNGVGIEPNLIERIFDPFFSTKGKGKGTGLGLAVVYGVLKNLSGFIKVYSEPGKGSIFRVYLPVSGRPLGEKVTPEVKEILEGNESILIVDDETDIRELARDIFVEHGYRILLAEDGEKACEIYAEKHAEIDLVLLDMVMPNLGGLETFLTLRTINPQVKVILSSGYSENGRAQEIIRYGVSDFIQKPYQVHKLLAMVRQVLARGN
ncbi:MAG: PAS domain S-box protein [Candidatus Aminicenantes bacterium]|nr:PAS domain S-box protein [Candidatus Aminicenantes bacterium]